MCMMLSKQTVRVILLFTDGCNFAESMNKILVKIVILETVVQLSQYMSL